MRVMLIAVAALAVSLAGCYVEPEQDRAKGSEVDSEENELTKECEKDWSLGCLAGFIIPGSSLKVQGKSFINADQLHINFHQILSYQQAEEGTIYQTELARPLDSNNFADDFEVRLSSNKAMKTRVVGKDGRFTFDYLPDGEYSIELSKRVDFRVVKRVACESTPSDESGDESASELPTKSCASEETKHYCGLLSGAASVRVRRNEQLIKTFPTFDFYVMGEDCESAAQDNVIDF